MSASMGPHPTITLIVTTPRATLHPITTRLASAGSKVIIVLLNHVGVLRTAAGSTAYSTTRFLV